MSAHNEIDFTNKWIFSDVVFVVEDKRLHACKNILSMWSPVFMAMHEGSFKERDAEEVVLPDKRFDAVLNLLQTLHPPCKELEESSVEELLPLLQEYQIYPLLEQAQKLLCDQAASVKNFLLAKQFSLPRLEEHCMEFLRRAPLSQLKRQPQYDQLEASFVVTLLEGKLEHFERNVEDLRKVRMVLERKKPTTFPGMDLLCQQCHSAREQQVDCSGCLNACCQRLTCILRDIDS